MSDPKIHIVTEKEFSDHIANQVMFTNFRVYSKRGFVNVITSWCPDRCPDKRDDGNHKFAPNRGNAREWVEACIRHVMELHGWDGPEFHLENVRLMPYDRGQYRAILWRDK